MKFIYHEKIGYVDPKCIQAIEVVNLIGGDEDYEVCYGPFGARNQQVIIGTKQEADDFAAWLANEVEVSEN